MQAYQSTPCPYCGSTWNVPGAQTCANCRNALPPPPPAYAPPGYQGPVGPPGGQETAAPYAPYPPAPGFPQPYPPGSAPANQGYPPYQTPYPYAIGPQGSAPGYPGAAGNPWGQVQGGVPAPAGPTLRLFGRTFALPSLSRGPLVVPRVNRRIVLVGALVAVILLVLVVAPAIASAQVSGTRQALATAQGHEPAVDAAMALFLNSSRSAPGNLTAARALTTKDLSEVQSALASVKGDESALSGYSQRMQWLSYVALSQRTNLQRERQRATTALSGLAAADQVLTAAGNQAQLALVVLDVSADYVKVNVALSRRDYPAAAALYPDEQQKLNNAARLAQAPGIAPVEVQELRGYTDLINNTELLGQALEARDGSGSQKYAALVQSEIKALNAVSPTAGDDWNRKTFSALISAYDAGLKSAGA